MAQKSDAMKVSKPLSTCAGVRLAYQLGNKGAAISTSLPEATNLKVAKGIQDAKSSAQHDQKDDATDGANTASHGTLITTRGDAKVFSNKLKSDAKIPVLGLYVFPNASYCLDPVPFACLHVHSHLQVCMFTLYCICIPTSACVFALRCLIDTSQQNQRFQKI